MAAGSNIDYDYDFEAEPVYSLRIRFVALQFTPKQKLQLKPNLQPLWRKHVEKAGREIQRILSKLLTKCDLVINSNATADCELPCEEDLNELLENFKAHKTNISELCTKTLVKYGAARDLGFKDEEFGVVVHIIDKDVEKAVAYFKQLSVGEADEPDIKVTGIRNELSAPTNNDDDTEDDSKDSDSDKSTVSNSASETGKSKKKKRKKKKVNKKERKRRREEMESTSDIRCGSPERKINPNNCQVENKSPQAGGQLKSDTELETQNSPSRPSDSSNTYAKPDGGIATTKPKNIVSKERSDSRPNGQAFISGNHENQQRRDVYNHQDQRTRSGSQKDEETTRTAQVTSKGDISITVTPQNQSTETPRRHTDSGSSHGKTNQDNQQAKENRTEPSYGKQHQEPNYLKPTTSSSAKDQRSNSGSSERDLNPQNHGKPSAHGSNTGQQSLSDGNVKNKIEQFESNERQAGKPHSEAAHFQSQKEGMFDPPIAIPPEFKDQVVLFRVYIGEEYKHIHSVTLHLHYHHTDRSDYQMEKCHRYPTIWYLVGQPEGRFTYSFTIHHKKGLWDKFKNIFTEISSTSRDASRRPLTEDITTDIFNNTSYSDYGASVIGLMTFIYMTGEFVTGENVCKLIATWAKAFAEKVAKFPSHYRLVVIEELSKQLENKRKEEQLFILSIILLTCKTCSWSDLIRSETFTVNSAACVLEALRVKFRFDEDIQSVIPGTFKVCFTKCNGAGSKSRKPTLMDFILQCYPNVYEDTVVDAASLLTDFESNTERITQAIVRLIENVHPENTAMKPLFQAVTHYVELFEVLFEAAKTVEKMLCHDKVKKEFKCVAQDIGEEKVRKSFETIAVGGKVGLQYFFEYITKIQQHCPEILNKSLGEIESSLIRIFRRTSIWIKEEMQLGFNILSQEDIFNTQSSVNKMFAEMQRGAYTVQMMETVLYAVLQKPSSLVINLDNYGEEVLKKAWTSGKSYDEALLELYRVLHHIEKTKGGEKGFVDRLHKYIQDNYLSPKFDGKRLLRIVSKIKEDEKMFQQLREDAMRIIEKDVNTYAKGDLDKWLQDSFGTKIPIVLNSYILTETLLLGLGLFTEKLKMAKQSTSQNDMTEFFVVMNNCDFIHRIMTSTGHYAYQVKNHNSMEFVREVALRFAEKISTRQLSVSTLSGLEKETPKWREKYIRILHCFVDSKTVNAIKHNIDQLDHTIKQARNQQDLANAVLEKLLILAEQDSYSRFKPGLQEMMAKVQSTIQNMSQDNLITDIEKELQSDAVQRIFKATEKVEQHFRLNMFWIYVEQHLDNFVANESDGESEGECLESSASEESLEEPDDCLEDIRLIFDDGIQEQECGIEKGLELLDFIAEVCSTGFSKEIRSIFTEHEDDVSIEDVKKYLTAKTFMKDMETLEEVAGLAIPDFKRRAICSYFTLHELSSLASDICQLMQTFDVEVQDTTADLDKSLAYIELVADGEEVLLLKIDEICNPLAGLYQKFKDMETALDVLHVLIHSTQMISFLQSIEGDDLRNLIDAVEEYTEEYVQESTVSDFIQIHGYLRPLLNAGKVKSASHFLDLFWEVLQVGDSGMASKIDNCSHNFHNLKSLYMNVSNRGEVTKETISNILDNSTIKMHVTVGKSEVSIDYKRHTNIKTLHLSELNDLNSRAHLIANTEQETGSIKIKLFVDLAALINEVVEIAEDLCTRGHFDYQKFEKTIHHSTPENKIQVLRGLSKTLEMDLNDWDRSLEEGRDRFFFLNFVYSEQIPILYEFLKTGDNAKRAKAILKYMSSTLDLSSVRSSTVISAMKKASSAAGKIRTLGEVLEKICPKTASTTQFPSTDEFRQMTQNINAVVRPGKLFVAQIAKNSDQTIPVMLNLYANTSGTLPLANQVLFCTKDTSWEEVQMLVQRCVLSQQKQLFCLAWVEELDYTVQNQLVKYLSELAGDSTKTDYFLAVICRELSSHPLVQKLSSHVKHIIGMNSTSIKECFEKVASNTTSITSEVPGLGKTEFVYERAAEMDLSVQTIPISGYVEKEELVKSVPDWMENHVLHFDIGQLQNPEIMDSFLFELMVLKCATSGTYMVHMNQQQTFIEVANTLEHSLRNSLVLISHFDRIHLEWDDYKSMRISTELCSPVQVVCHYLDSLQNGSVSTTDLVFCGKTNLKPLIPQRCTDLLRQNFAVDIDMSYIIVNVFLEVLAHQLKKLSTSQYFRIENLKVTIGEKDVGNVRIKMLKRLIDMSREFACRSIHTCKSTQARAVLKTEEAFTESMSDRMSGMIQWADSNHFLVLFNSLSSHTITPLYRNRSDVVKQEKNILDLIESQLKIDLPDFHKYSHDQLQSMLEKLVCKRQDPEARKRLKTSLPNYALTPDNLIKMVLISLRIVARLPVIIMGETGCGKTSLVRYLATTCGVECHVINFHAGIQKEDITDKIFSYNQIAIKEGKEIWVFLDEINTCDHLGIINDIMCHHTCKGRPLTPNLVFIAACNPYRLRSASQVLTAGLVEKAKTDEFSRLVYRVYPLPESMLDYIWDYGVLNEKDEKLYIKEMVKDVFKTYSGCTIRDKLTELIALSQAFVKEVEKNESCVSLRDVNRCRLLFPWFDEMLLQKGIKSKEKLSTEDRTKRAAFLSLAHCYAVRLQTTEDRIKYWGKISVVVYGKLEYGDHIMGVVREEQMEILNRMSVPEGIAKNTALRENLFVLFVSIMNRMPIFLVGKPGCSKSLSMQLLKNNLRGLDSSDDYFKTLPQLYVVSYQGSEASTSEGILKVFDKAEKYMKHNSTENVLPVVLLDEVGLAEVSTHNPLKVLHSLLEPAGKEFPDIAVVGISNWALDAAKMNRAVHLSRPDLSIDELVDTALSISTTVDKDESQIVTVSPTTLKALAKAYYEYQKKQKTKNFHGLRDFYSLIKCVSREVIARHYAPDDQRIEEVIYDGLLRNFGGGTEIDVIIETFFSALESTNTAGKVSTEQLIADNLNDKQSRHLLLITRGDSLLDPLGQILRDNGKSFEVTFGSNFEDDKCEGYQYRILSKIIHCMEIGKVLILKDLEDIYGSLYDMLNQNYTIVGKRKNCRIALGAHSNPMCHVHDDFKCIVLIEEDKLDFSDPPFLNRFEKQHLLFDDLLLTEEQEIVQDLEKWVTDFADVGESFFKVTDAFMGFNKDTLPSLVKLVTNTYKQMEEPEFTIIEMCKQMLLMTTPPDAIVRLPRTKLMQRSEEECYQIRQNYFELPLNAGLLEALEVLPNLKQSIQGTESSKYVIFTHSNVHTDVEKLLKNRYVPHVVQLSSLRTEKQLTTELEKYYASEEENALVVQCQPATDADNLLHLKILIEGKERDYKKVTQSLQHKMVCIILHADRIDEEENVRGLQFAYNQEWIMCAIGRLEDSDVALKDVIGWSISEMIKSSLFQLENVIIENLLWAFTCFKYKREDAQGDLLALVTSISENEHLLECFKNRILLRVENDSLSQQANPYHPEHWQVEVACDSQSLLEGKSLMGAWMSYLTELIKRHLIKVVWFLEKTSAWNSILTSADDTLRIKLWQQMFSLATDDKSLDQCIAKGAESVPMTSQRLPLKFPFTKLLFDDVHSAFLLFEREVQIGVAYRAVENLESMAESDVVELLNQYVPLVEHKCDNFCSDSSIISSYWLMIYEDLLYLFSDHLEFVMEDESWLKIVTCFLGKKAKLEPGKPWEETLTTMFLSFFLIAPQIEIFTSLIKSYGDEAKELMSNAIDEYSENDEDPVTDSIVRCLCQKYLPYKENIMETGSVEKLVEEVPTILAFCSRLSCFPQEFHALRLFADFYRLCPESGNEFITAFQKQDQESSADSKKIKDFPLHEPDQNSNSDNSDDENLFFTAKMEIADQTSSTLPVLVSDEGEGISGKEDSDTESNSDAEESGHISKPTDSPVASENEALILEEKPPTAVAEVQEKNEKEDADFNLDEDFQNEQENETEQDIPEADNLSDEADDSNKEAEETSVLDSQSLFNFFKKMLKKEANTSGKYQQMFCLYVSRCIDANPDTPLMDSFLKEIENLPNMSLRFAGAVLKRILQLDTYDVMESCVDSNPEVWNDVNEILDDFIKSDPPENVINLMCDILQQKIQEKEIDVWEMLEKFKAASKTVQTGSFSEDGLTYVIRLAFCKAYIESLLSVLQNPTKRNDMTKSYDMTKLDGCLILRDFENTFGFSSHLQINLIRQLNQGTIKGLQTMVRDAETSLRSFKDIKFPSLNVVEYGLGYRQIMKPQQSTNIDTILESIGEIEKKFLPILENTKGNADALQELLVTLAERFFWVKFLESAKDSDKKWASDLDKKIKPSKVSHVVKMLVRHLCGQKDFPHQSMHISTQTRDVEFYHACSIFYAIATAIPLHGKSMDNCSLTKVIFEHEKCSKMKITSFLENAPEPDLTKAKCTCNHVIFSLKCEPKCSVCSRLNEEHVTVKSDSQAMSVTRTIQEMLIADQTSETPIDEATKLLLQIATLASVNLEISKPKNLDKLYEAFQQTWSHVKEMLSLDDRATTLLIEIMISKLLAQNTKTPSDLQKHIAVILQEREQLLETYKTETYVAEDQSQGDNFVRYLLELDNNEDGSCISRCAKTPTLDDLKVHIGVQISLTPQANPFLRLVHCWQNKLKLIKLLDPIAKFVVLLNSNVTHRLTREESQRTVIFLFVNDKKDEFHDTFDEFNSAWGQVIKNKQEFVEYLPKDTNIGNFYPNSNVDEFVCKDQNHIIIQIIEALAKWQNAFLQKSSGVALTGCSSLKFLLKNDTIPLPVKSLYQLRRKQLVEFDWETDLLLHVQVDARTAQGTHVMYDLDAIELELANQLLVGKAYIENEMFETATYRNEMFHSSSQILLDLRTKLQQKDIPQEIISELNAVHSDDPGLMSKLNGMLEVVLPLVLRTGGNPGESIGSVATRWKIDIKTINNSKLSSLLGKSIELRHLAALYEYSEDRAAELVMKSLPEQYKVDITNQEDKTALLELDKKIGSAEIFLVVLRRIAMRSLRSNSEAHVDFAPEKPICELVNNPSLWPHGMVTSNHQVVYQSQQYGFEELIPPTLRVKHIHSVYSYLEINIVMNEKKREPARTRITKLTGQTRRMRQSKLQRRA